MECLKLSHQNYSSRPGGNKTNLGYNFEATNPSSFENAVDVHSHTPPFPPFPPRLSLPVVALSDESEFFRICTSIQLTEQDASF